MHLLRTFLLTTDKQFSELPFESVLAGRFSPAVAKTLSEFGLKHGQEISLLNLGE